MDKNDHDKYLALYISTAKEYVGNLLDALESLRQNPQNERALEIAHRNAHNIKSQSLVMGFEHIGNVAHEIEKITAGYIDQHSHPTDKTIDIMKSVAEKMETSINSIENKNTELLFDDEMKELNTLTR